jgi:hypothetical protein
MMESVPVIYRQTAKLSQGTRDMRLQFARLGSRELYCDGSNRKEPIDEA